MVGSANPTTSSDTVAERRSSAAKGQIPAASRPDVNVPAVATVDPAAKPQPATGRPAVPSLAEPASLADHYSYVSVDRAFKANLARLTSGPAARA